MNVSHVSLRPIAYGLTPCLIYIGLLLTVLSTGKSIINVSLGTSSLILKFSSLILLEVSIGSDDASIDRLPLFWYILSFVMSCKLWPFILLC